MLVRESHKKKRDQSSPSTRSKFFKQYVTFDEPKKDSQLFETSNPLEITTFENPYQNLSPS